jgi:hypothetical protein
MPVTIMPQAARKLPYDSQYRVLIPTLGPEGEPMLSSRFHVSRKKISLGCLEVSLGRPQSHFAVPSSERSL